VCRGCSGFAKYFPIAEFPLEKWSDGFDIDEGFIDVEDNDGRSAHRLPVPVREIVSFIFDAVRLSHRMHLRYLGSLFYETEDVQVREEFCGYKNQGNGSHRDLCILAPDRLTWDGLLPPLSRWAFS
jgi:hypothetical protein